MATRALEVVQTRAAGRARGLADAGGRGLGGGSSGLRSDGARAEGDSRNGVGISRGSGGGSGG